MPRAANESYWSDSRLRSEAEGFQFLPDGTPQMEADTNPDPARRNPKGIFSRNGGLVAMRRVTLAVDNRMFRFANRRHLGGAGLAGLLNSPWWMEEDRMFLLLCRAREAAVPLIEMSRRQLALPAAWTDADIIVSVRLRPAVTLAAYAGPGMTASANGESRIVAREAPHLFIDQLYVPGLGSPGGDRAKGLSNANAWFDAAGAKSFDPAAKGFNP